MVELSYRIAAANEPQDGRAKRHVRARRGRLRRVAGLVQLGLAVGLAAWATDVTRAREPGRPRVELPAPADAAPVDARPASAGSPADFRSTHFVLHTDLPPREARELLARLETMLGLVAKYWGQAPAGVIECYVVRDLNVWPADSLDAAGREKIRQGSGITHIETVSRGRRLIAGKAVVYATADRGTPQHEAVHAYCGQTFGRVGPLWYSEGMAELGQHWVQGDTSVNCPDYVIEYLRNSRPKRVRQILDEEGDRPGSPARTGDSWQNYTWRWALCHLLVNNPTYSERFRALGLGYLSGAPVNFAAAYNGMSEEIEFEYRFLLDHLAPGYRVDLCRWDWRRKFREPAEGSTVRVRVMANRGWQPSGAIVARGQSYDLRAEGVWQIGPERRDVTAAGLPGGAGTLEGVIWSDYELSEPFRLSAEGRFAPPRDGRLYLRCRDAWNELADNSGFMAVKIKKSGPVAPPAPAEAIGQASTK